MGECPVSDRLTGVWTVLGAHYMDESLASSRKDISCMCRGGV